MSKYKLRAILDDGLFVVLVMAGAIASAALEAGAVMGGLPGRSLSAYAQAAAPAQVAVPAAPASAPERMLATQAVERLSHQH